MAKTIKRKNKLVSSIDSSKRKQTLEKHALVEKSCSKCGQIVERVSPTAISVICSICVTQMCPPEIKKPKVKKTDDGFLKGWKWMKRFVHADGRVFERGIEKPKLKGKYPPTPPKEKKKRRSKYEIQMEKEAKLAKRYEKKIKEKKKKEKKKAKNLSTKFFGE